MAILTWLHISDLHIRRAGTGTREQKRKIAAVLEDVRDIRAGKLALPGVDLASKPIDLVLMTGDIANAGDRREYTAAATFAQTLSDIAGTPLSRFLMVPGNHDIQRRHHRADDAGTYAKIKDAESAAGLRKALDEVDLRPQARGKARSEASRALTRKLGSFTEFRAGFGSDLDDAASVRAAPSGAWLWNMFIDGSLVEVIGFDSAWACGSDLDDLTPVVGEHQREEISELLANAPAESALRVVLQHHPTDTLLRTDRHDHERWLAKNRAVCLAGHVHDHGHRITGLAEGMFLEIVGGSAYKAYVGDHRYSFGQCRFGAERDPYLRIVPRVLPENETRYHRDGTFGANDAGVFDFAERLQLPFESPLTHGAIGRSRLPKPVMVTRDENRITFKARAYSIAATKTLGDVQSPVAFPVRVYANKFPDDKTRSMRLYARSPLDLDAIQFEARVDGKPSLAFDVELDTPSLKELTIPLPRGSRVLEYGYTVPERLWGNFFQREIRLPTEEFVVVLEVHGRAVTAEARFRTLTADGRVLVPRRSEDADVQRFEWKLERPDVGTKFVATWTF